MDETQHTYETWNQKFKRKFKENPWVPIGCLATTGALFMASVRMRHGKSQDMQYWLRARVVLQGATVIALVGGSMAYSSQKQQSADTGDVSMKEANAEQKREQEKAEFEARLKGAEIAHAQEQAFLSQTPATSQATGGAPATDRSSTEQTTSPTTGDSTRKSSWKRWLWGSGGSDKSS